MFQFESVQTQGAIEQHFHTIKHGFLAGRKNLRIDEFTGTMFTMLQGMERDQLDRMKSSKMKVHKKHVRYHKPNINCDKKY